MNQYALHVHTFGPTTPRSKVLALHGFGGSGLDFQHCASASDREWLAPDIPGHGRSEWPRGKSFVQVAELALPAAPDPLHLVGYSMGARLALQLWATHPERFKSITLIGVNAGIQPDAKMARKGWEDRVEDLMREGVTSWLNYWDTLPLFASRRTSTQPACIEAAARRHRQQDTLPLTWNALATSTMPDLWHVLLDAHPKLLLVGEDDHKYRDIYASRHVPFESIDRCGHSPHLEAPQVVASVLDAFFEDVDATLNKPVA